MISSIAPIIDNPITPTPAKGINIVGPICGASVNILFMIVNGIMNVIPPHNCLQKYNEKWGNESIMNVIPPPKSNEAMIEIKA